MAAHFEVTTQADFIEGWVGATFTVGERQDDEPHGSSLLAFDDDDGERYLTGILKWDDDDDYDQLLHDLFFYFQGQLGTVALYEDGELTIG